MRRGKELQGHRCADTSRNRCAGHGISTNYNRNRTRYAFKRDLRPEAQLQDQKDNGGVSGNGADILE